MPGYAAIVYSCKEFSKAVETVNESLSIEKNEGNTVGSRFIFQAFE